MKAFEEICRIGEIVQRTNESLGGSFLDPFNEIGTIISVSDPKNLGRVQVLYSEMESDWVYVQGSHKGRLTAQYIGAPCLLVKSGGNTNDMFVSHVFNKDPLSSGIGTPMQFTVIGEQMAASEAQSDPGLKCSVDNVGRTYMLENEVGMDVVVCLRRNNLQEEGEKIYFWKSLTHRKVVEKGFDPGVVDTPSSTNLSSKIGIPKCFKGLEGEIIEFTEDKSFRSFLLTCRRDENEDFSWIPVSSPPVVFRTTLPTCSEKNHGMEVVVDPGDNSELAICLRYQGQMKWVHPGTRRPLHFHQSDPPPTRDTMLKGKGPMPALATQPATPSSSDLVGKSGKQILDFAAGAVSALGKGSGLASVEAIASSLPGDFNGKKIITDLAGIAVGINSGQPTSAVLSKITQALASGGVIDEELSSTLSKLGGAGDVLAAGIKGGSFDAAWEAVGAGALNQAIRSLSPEVASVFTGYMSGGAVGAIDSAAMLGLSQLPPEVSQFVSPVWDLGKDLINGQPLSVSNILGSAIGALDQTLPDSVNAIISSVGGANGIASILSGDITSALAGGGLGEIAQMAASFANIPGIPNLEGLSGVPQLATSALQMVGLGSSFTSLLGPAGIGLSAFSALTGIDPVGAILGGIPGIGGLFGGGGSECPCDPKCRKTSHGVDSDGLSLLEPCGSVIKSGHSSYSPSGNPAENNDNPITDFLPTGLGSDLCVKNPFDLTKILKAVSRLKDLADRMEGATFADWPEFISELLYSLEAIEKALKQADNNITKIESIERKLLDSQYRIIEQFFSTSKSFFPRTHVDIAEHAQALMDVQYRLELLNEGKDGTRFPEIKTLTPALLATKKNIKQIPKMSLKAQKAALETLSKSLKPAHKEWKEMTPGEGLMELADIALGLFNPDVPANFDNCKTKRDKNKVLQDSLKSKLNSPVPPEPSSLIGNSLPAEYFSLPPVPTTLSVTPSTPPTDIASILDQINYDQGRALNGQADC